MAQRGEISTGEAIKASSAAIVFGITSNIAVVILGVMVAFVYRKTGPQPFDWTLIIGACAVVWGVIALSSLNTATRGLERTVPQPNPLQQHYGDEKGQVAVPLDDLPRWLPGMPKIGDVYAVDLAWFVKRIIVTRDWTQRAWDGVPMPSGMTCDKDYHRALMRPIVHSGIVIGYRRRTKGRLLCRSTQTAINHLKIPEILPSYPILLDEFERSVKANQSIKFA